jgi:TP901 family phage tail tape measure protein
MGARDVVFTILAIDEASKTFDKIGRKVEETGGKFGVIGKMAGLGLAAVGVGAAAAVVESVKLASSFQSTMEQLATQAHVPQKAVDQLGQGVLDLAGKVGAGPDSLAEALYHIESSFSSTGIKGSEAMHLLQTAAEGAKMGHADLVDVTNALDAAVVSGIPGVQNFDQAMGMLNATVGSGDMHMQDLSEAFGTGAVAVVKNYGLSLRDVGASLAVLGDNNIRGAEAGTALRMTVQSLAVPARTGKKALAELGLQTDTLAKDMQTGGLQKAVTDLHDRLKKTGNDGNKAGNLLTQAFGKKAGVGLVMLVDQFDRLKSKYGELDKGSKGFAHSWAQQQATFAQQWDQFKAGVEGALTKLGIKLLPMLTKMMPGAMKIAVGAVNGLSKAIDGVSKVVVPVFNFIKDHSTIFGTLAAAVTAGAAAWAVWTGAIKVWQGVTKVATAIQAAFDVVMDANPIMLVVIAIAALTAGIIYAYTHSKTFRDIVTAVWADVKNIVMQCVRNVIGAWSDMVHAGAVVIKWFQDLPGRIRGFLSGLPGMLAGIGANMVSSLAGAIAGAAGAVVGAIKGVVGGAINAAKSLLGIASPSKVFLQIGNYVGEGFTQGLIASRSRANSEMSHLMDLVSRTGNKGMERFVTTTRGKLLHLWDAKNADAAAIKAQQSRLKSLQTSFAQERGNVRSSIVESGNITGGSGTDYGSIVFHLQNVVNKSKQFYGVLKNLKKSGLGSTLINELIQAGPDQGLAYAQSILAQGKSGISQLNGLTNQLGAVGTQLGTVSADNMYGAGIRSAEGLIKGLKSKESAISKQMETIARNMWKTLDREMGVGQHGPVSTAHHKAAHHKAAATHSVTIHVHGVLDPAAAAKEIKRVLASASARGVSGKH